MKHQSSSLVSLAKAGKSSSYKFCMKVREFEIQIFNFSNINDASLKRVQNTFLSLSFFITNIWNALLLLPTISIFPRDNRQPLIPLIFIFKSDIMFQWKFLAHNISFKGISENQRHSAFFNNLSSAYFVSTSILDKYLVIFFIFSPTEAFYFLLKGNNFSSLFHHHHPQQNSIKTNWALKLQKKSDSKQRFLKSIDSMVNRNDQICSLYGIIFSSIYNQYIQRQWELVANQKSIVQEEAIHTDQVILEEDHITGEDIQEVEEGTVVEGTVVEEEGVVVEEEEVVVEEMEEDAENDRIKWIL